MTETEWLTADRVEKLLRYVHSKMGSDASDRKLRLFGVACCRRVAEQIPDPTLSAVVDGCEGIADTFAFPRLFGLAAIAGRVLDSVLASADTERDRFEYARAVCQLTEYPIFPEHCADSCMQALCGHDDYYAGQGEVLFQVDFLRDVFGNPFRAVPFPLAWRTSTAVALAARMYESRDFSAVPILADALQDAGCDNTDVLGHCRGSGPHVRGCWAVDLVLGKEW